MSLEEEAIEGDMDAEYFPPLPHGPQQALLIDVLRLALRVVDGCWLAAADNFSSLRAFDGNVLSPDRLSAPSACRKCRSFRSHLLDGLPA